MTLAMKERRIRPVHFRAVRVVETQAREFGYNARQLTGGCIRKIAFDNLPRAQQAAHETPGTVVYECQFCPFWHVGHEKCQS